MLRSPCQALSLIRRARTEKNTCAAHNTRDAIYRAGQRGASTAVRQRAIGVTGQLMVAGSFQDLARAKLLESRKAITESWFDISGTLDAQGESSLANEARHFARHLPRINGQRTRCRSFRSTLREYTSDVTVRNRT